MLIIVDQKMPEMAKKRLMKDGDVLEMFSSGITYSYISGHPDIYICQTPLMPIIAPNIPKHITSYLQKNQISFISGTRKVGSKYPQTAIYNAVVNEKFIIHKTEITDPMLLRFSGRKKSINIPQGYTRCNLIYVGKNCYISSDESITRSLTELDLDILQVRTKDVVLPGFKYGFFGGACGFKNNRLYIAGSLTYFSDGSRVKEFAEKHEIEIVELYDGPLFDGGSILFLD